ncbi:MAG TPA: DUF4386 family protein [Gemmatimonadales bacterium]
MCGGVLLSTIAGLFHPDRQPANDHIKSFAEYSSSAHWTLIHLGQFAGVLVMVTGLVMLFLALSPQSRPWNGQVGVVLSVVALTLYGVLQAVDGVALKQAVDAWMRVPDAEKATRLASAEVIRWTEWGVRSYYSFMLGVSFALFGSMLARTPGVPRPIGYLMGLSGVAYIIQGWVLGSEGFSAAFTLPAVVAVVLAVVWSGWLLITAWRKVA